jgi:copper(I)-binding protein
MTIFNRGAIGFAALLTLSASALAQTPAPAIKHGTLTIEQPWSRATPGGAKVAGGFMRITNTGTEPERLVGGSFLLAARFQVHEMSESGGVMRMREVEKGLEIKPGATVELKPGGYHIMFLDLKEPLKEGQVVKGTLQFEKAGPVEVEYAVRSIGAQGSTGEHRH